MNETERTFNIEELAALAGTTRRAVRFYVQAGLLDRPEGQARGAYYTRRHLQRLLDIQAWQAEGLTLEGIRRYLAARTTVEPERRRSAIEVWTRLNLDDGVELHLNADEAGLSPDHVRDFANKVREVLRAVRGGSGKHD